jgi:hypothetical protein
VEVEKEDNNPYTVRALPPVLSVNDPPVSFPARALLGSLMVMLPWPIVGIAACVGLSLFEESSEAVFMFGSATMILLLPLAFVVSSEWVFGILVAIVWLSVLLLPVCFGRKCLHPRFHVAIVFVCQSLFAAVQAGLGFLVVLGKQC